ncbi:MAG: DHH family phosphoesterase, partial [Clostridia bacterium]|nr:DHH family phosphoesterase [Clostridia bacterium]
MKEIKNINEIKSFIDADNSFGIICHQNPDGDTLGAGFAMYHGLKQLGKECNVYCIDKPEKVFDMIDGIEVIKSVKEVKEKSIIFCDCSDETRALFENDLKDYNVLNIDHHFSNTGFGNINVVFDDACAACQVVYHLLLGIGVTMDEKIAKCLYIGICTDTNNFTNSNVKSDIFFVAGELVKFGIDVNPIIKALFKTKSLAKTKATA